MFIQKLIQRQRGRYRRYTSEYDSHILESQMKMSRLNLILFFAHGMFVCILEDWLWKSVSMEFYVSMAAAGISLAEYILCLWYLPKHKNQALLTSDIYVGIMIIVLVSTDIFLQPTDESISSVLITVTLILSAIVSLIPFHFWSVMLVAVVWCVGEEIYVLMRTNVPELYDKISWLYYSLDYLLIILFALAINWMFANLKFSEIKREHDLRSKVQTDQLTGLYNRQYMEQAVEDYSHTKGTGMMFCIDLDNFKQVNDTFGHGKGDEVLIQVSNILKTCFHKNDYVARVGGDEFLVFMHPVKGEEDIVNSIHRLLKRFPVVASEGKKEIKVMLSIGGALLEENTESAYEFLYKKSDEVMYEAKQGGKGRAVIAANRFMPKSVISRNEVNRL